MKELLVIAGDGIGREVIPAAEACLRAVLPALHTTYGEAGREQWRRTGHALEPGLVERLQAVGAALMGPELPYDGPERSAMAALTHALDLFVTFYVLYPARGASPLVLLVPHEVAPGAEPVRELSPEGAWQATRVGNVVGRFAERGMERIALVHDHEESFARAVAGGISHNADVEPLDALFFLNQIELLVEEHDLFVMSAPTARLFLERVEPARYLPAERARLVVGPGGMIAQPAHGALPEQLGWGFANPLGAIYAAEALLTFGWGEMQAARRLEHAVRRTLRQRRTPDRGGLDTLNEVTRAIVRNVEATRA